MIKKLFRQPSAKKITANYSSYADFTRNASVDEKQIVIKDAIKKANTLQKQIAS